MPTGQRGHRRPHNQRHSPGLWCDPPGQRAGIQPPAHIPGVWRRIHPRRGRSNGLGRPWTPQTGRHPSYLGLSIIQFLLGGSFSALAFTIFIAPYATRIGSDLKLSRKLFSGWAGAFLSALHPWSICLLALCSAFGLYVAIFTGNKPLSLFMPIPLFSLLFLSFICGVARDAREGQSGQAPLAHGFRRDPGP